MKVNLDLSYPRNRVQFEGYKPIKSDYGDREYEFNYVYNEEEKDCYLEIFLVDKDDNGNYFVTGKEDEFGNILPIKNYNLMINNPQEAELGLKLKKGKATKVDLAAEYGIAPNQAFAYHYKLYPKDQKGIPEYKLDAGNIINDAYRTHRAHEIYNIVTDRASTGTKSGSMKLIVPDFNNVSWIYDNKNNIVPNPNIEQARKNNKTMANKIGGSLAGIEKDLEEGKLDNYTRIITTPLFTDDSLAAHAYWNKNCFQMAHSLGNINNYASLQRKLFAKGINLVSDGAYVNEGLEGVHFKHILQWGEKSPYFNWFKISGLQDSPLSMGVFGKKLGNVTHRIVNSKYKYEQNQDGSITIKNDRNYKANQPTYIQIYDKRLVNADKLSNKELIKAYDKLAKNCLEINNHNDTVVPYSFQINNETLKKNIISLSEFNKSVPKVRQLDLKSGEATRAISQFEYFGLDGKHESGFETWDANPDIAKLSFVQSHTESQALKNIPDPIERAEYKALLKRKNMEVQDYAVSSAMYWTQKTNRILNLNVAQHLRNIDKNNAKEIFEKIQRLSNGEVLPKDLDINENIVKNVLKNRYNFAESEVSDIYENAILQGLMNTPLDSVEVGDDIVSVLASPYMTKRATSEEQIGVSRFRSYVEGNAHLMPEYARAYNNVDKMYKKELLHLATKIINNIEKSLPDEQKFQDENGFTTPYGKYILPLLTAEIARFAVIKGVSPNAKFTYDKNTGEITYNYNELKSTSLLKMGIIASDPEDEAICLTNKIKNRTNSIKKEDIEELTKALSKSIEGTSLESFKLAEMIVSRAQAGLDWRIDATKDIADIESLRNGKTDFEYTWDEIIKFWTKFTDGVKKYHPDAYIAAEVTDDDDTYNKGNGWNSGSRYSNSKEAVKKLINEAGFTTIANYSYFSSEINKIFGKLFDFDGENSPDKGLQQGLTVREQLMSFLNSGPLESIIYSYIFAGNHDKCRALDGYAMDMDMVYTDLTNPSNYEYRQRAYKILHAMPYGNDPYSDSVNCYDYTRVSPLAIARCESIASGMGKAAYRVGFDDNRAKYVYGKMLDALRNLANGKFKGEIYEAEGFGTKDFPNALDILFEEMDYIEPNQNIRLSQEEKKKLYKKTLEMILDPAMSKLLGHTKFLTALTGNPTLFAGDEYGSSGYETTTKNITVQNRNIIHEEWAEEGHPDYMEFIKRHKNNIEDQYNFRTRTELEPLNNGAPFVLKPQFAKYSKAVYNDNFNDNVSHYENGETQLSGLLRQSTNGRITVSVFNTEGLTHKFDEYYRPAEITIPSIDLNSDKPQVDRYTDISGLKPGMKFKNADKNDSTTYYVNDNNQITGPNGSAIKFKDSVLTLYHEPSFTGNRKTMYNPQYNFVSNPYTHINKEKIELGKNLALISK